MGRWKARYAGRCGRCDYNFPVGEMIERTTTGWQHVKCLSIDALDPLVYGDNDDYDYDDGDPNENPRRVNQQIHEGMRHAEHIRETREWFGEQAAIDEEYAHELKYGDGW